MFIHLSGKFSPLNYLFHNKQIRPTTSERIIQISARQELQKKKTSRGYQPKATTSWQRSASGSKRRCLSSLQFSPLNLSWVHPCKPNKQNEPTASECKNQISTKQKLWQKHGPARGSQQQVTISWRRSASESKRRCLSSLQFSPLNLSVVHPCKPNKQIRFNCIWMQQSDQCKTKASKNIKKHRPATRGYQPKATNGP